MTTFNLISFLWTDPRAKHTGNFEFGLQHAVKLFRQASKGFEALKAEDPSLDYYLTLVTDNTDLTGFDFSIPNVRVIPMWDTFRGLGRCFTKLRLFSKTHTDPVYGDEIHRSQLFPGDYLISLDLDIVITDPVKFVRELTSYRLQDFRGYRDSKNPRCYSGALWRISTHTYGEWHWVYDSFRHVHDTLAQNHEAYKFFYSNWNSKASFVGSDQCWISTVIGEGSYPNKWDGLSSGIYDMWTVQHLPTLPLNTCAVFLNGMARDMTIAPYKDLPWVQENWHNV